MRVPTVLMLAVLGFGLASCDDLAGTGLDFASLNPVEDFVAADTPSTYAVASLSFTGPWGYGKAENSGRLYPLVVSGYWGEGMGRYGAVETRFPAFVLDYQRNTEADGEALALWVSQAVAAGYRIDTNRIYLTGFSMGGSGSFPLARGMFRQGKYFAGIIRVAGQSESDLGSDILSRTALWYHIGLDDTAQRVDVARAALANNRAYACNSAAVESSETDTMGGFSRTTVTLQRQGISMFKYSEYAGMGHDSSACYADPGLFPWLFSQTLALH